MRRARTPLCARLGREGDWLLGGFSPPKRPIADPFAFFFSLTNSLGRPEKLASKGAGYDLYYHPYTVATFGIGFDLFICSDADTGDASWTKSGSSYAASASTGTHPMAQGRQGGWLAAEVVAWLV